MNMKPNNPKPKLMEIILKSSKLFISHSTSISHTKPHLLQAFLYITPLNVVPDQSILEEPQLGHFNVFIFQSTSLTLGAHIDEMSNPITQENMDIVHIMGKIR